jgi:hypothetical protein
MSYSKQALGSTFLTCQPQSIPLPVNHNDAVNLLDAAMAKKKMVKLERELAHDESEVGGQTAADSGRSYLMHQFGDQAEWVR